MFKIQTKYILEFDWDILIILDICWFDIFKEISKNIIPETNKIKKMIRPAIQTVEWLNKTFNGNYYPDIIYVSSNPFINSKGIKVKQGGYGFNAKPRFKKIIDVWDTSWNPNISTVHPIDVNKAANVSLDLRKKYKHIIHYMQPHSPYIYYGGLKSHLHPIQNIQKNSDPAYEFKLFSKISRKFLSQEMIWKIGKTLGREPTWDIGKIWLQYGREGIVKGYREDLKLALFHIKKLIDLFPNRKIIITSDHGERLGENGNYGHGGKREKQVIEVP